MAKRRKSSRKSSKCPEPLNTMIDLAAGLTMGAIASHMESKYHYSKKGKINPYTVSAMGLASGKMKTTGDILRTGAVLGALGSFDVEADDEIPHRTFVPEDPVFTQIRETKVNDNRYAWRLNCEDGSQYGISPYDYETREAYHAAIRKTKSAEAIVDGVQQPDIPQPSSADGCKEQCTFVRVSRLDNGTNQYYRISRNEVKVGDTVTVPTECGLAKGIVLAIENHPATMIPPLMQNASWIIEEA